ncbi:unnamed protein product, partial [Hapterophycus canaliculatus]
ENLQRLHKQSDRMNRLLDDLLAYARVGRRVIQPEKVDTKIMVAELLEFLSPTDAVELIIEGEMPSFATHRASLEQVFRNLLSNSIAHCSDSDLQITIACEVQDSMFEFRVSDNGVGVHPRHHERIFEMFQSLRSKDDGAGSGMGLAIIRRVLEIHGGRNEGPRFRIGDMQIVGNEYITEESLRARLELGPGDMFDGTIMRRDVGELVYGYGELGFIYAEVKPKTIMRDENGVADIIYEVTEGDRWKIGRIMVNIDGEPHLMRETTMLNLVDMREGDWIDRRTLELSRRRIERSQLLETNPMVAETPDIKVVPKEDLLR